MGQLITPYQLAARVASIQESLISRDQARQSGLTEDEIDHLVASRKWVAKTRGVYVVNGAAPSWRQDALVPVLAGPPGTVVSYLTAAAVHGLHPAPLLPHVTMPRSSSGRLKVAIVHRADLDPRDTTRAQGIRCTSVARTIIDSAKILAPDPLADLVDTALCKNLSAESAIRAAAARTPVGRGRRGLAVLFHVLETWTKTIKPGSPAEMRALRLIRQWGFPEPTLQYTLRDESGTFVARADLAWPLDFVLVEYEGKLHHNPRHWGRDEPRYQAVTALGWEALGMDKGDLVPGERRFRNDLQRAFDHQRAARVRRASPAAARLTGYRR